MSSGSGHGRTDGEQPILTSTDGSSYLWAVRVTSESTSGLRLHVAEQIEPPPTVADSQLAPLLLAFEKAVGWQLRFEQNPVGIGEAWSTPVESGQGPVGRLVLSPPQLPENNLRSRPAERVPRRDVGPRGPSASVDLSQARPLALAIAGFIGEL